MSIAIMQKVWEAPDMIASHKLVLMCLADCANEAGVCWPSIPGIAKKCCTSERNILKIINTLELNGFLQRKSRSGKTTLYTITPELGFISTPVPQFTPEPAYTPEPQDMEPLSPSSCTPVPQFTQTLNNHHITTISDGACATITPPEESLQVAKKKKRKPQGFPLTQTEGVTEDEAPDDWLLDAMKIKPDKAWIEKRWVDFWDYFTAGDATEPEKTNWKAAWLRWCRKEKERESKWQK